MVWKKSKKFKWYKYCLTIKGVKEYESINIEDYYGKEINTDSTFSEVIDISNNKNNFRTIIIETYDWAYIVICEDFEFEITGRR